MATMTQHASRLHHPINVTSAAFWAGTPEERDKSFRVLRDEAPVSWQPLMEGAAKPPKAEGMWVVTRHEHLVEVSRDPRRFSSADGVVYNDYPRDMMQAVVSFLGMDAPQHTVLRRLVSSAFTPKQTARMDEAIRAQCTRIVDGLLAAGEGDFVQLVSTRLPMWTINELVGLEGDLREEARHHAEVMIGMGDDEVAKGRPPRQVFNHALLSMMQIGSEFAAYRRAHPADDLMTNLINAEVDGRRLTDEEITAFFVMLTIGGNDTSANATSFGMHAFDRNPDQKALLMEDFDGRIGTAIEEIVRWSTPVTTFRRTATEDTVLGGQEIRAGDWVSMVYASANRDERAFEDPHQFNVLRSPNAHVGFGGGGPHFCLGVSLARRQLRELFGELLRRAPGLQIGEPEYLVGHLVNAVKRMPCSVQ